MPVRAHRGPHPAFLQHLRDLFLYFGLLSMAKPELSQSWRCFATIPKLNPVVQRTRRRHLRFSEDVSKVCLTHGQYARLELRLLPQFGLQLVRVSSMLTTASHCPQERVVTRCCTTTLTQKYNPRFLTFPLYSTEQGIQRAKLHSCVRSLCSSVKNSAPREGNLLFSPIDCGLLSSEPVYTQYRLMVERWHNLECLSVRL